MFTGVSHGLTMVCELLTRLLVKELHRSKEKSSCIIKNGHFQVCVCFSAVSLSREEKPQVLKHKAAGVEATHVRLRAKYKNGHFIREVITGWG